MKIVVYIILLGLLFSTIYGIWYGYNLHETFEESNEWISKIVYVSFDEFNSIFDADIVVLPKNIIGIGVLKDQIFIYNTEDINDSFVHRVKVFLSYFFNNIHNSIQHTKYYFVLCFWDGYTERIPQCMRSIQTYTPEKNQFKDFVELKLTDPCNMPIFHKNKAIFTFSKKISDKNSIAIPDIYYIEQQGYVNTNIKKINDNRILYSDKKNECVYRGSITSITTYNFINYQDKDGLNQREYLKRLYKNGGIKNFNFEDGIMSIEDQLKYKYILDVDGHSNTWCATVWKLYSGSVLLKTNSIWKQWYYDELKPWIHYVPIENDFSDINEKIQWCIDHDKECFNITQRAKIFVEEKLNWEKVKADTITIFKKYIEENND
jgi:hypothetical protein